MGSDQGELIRQVVALALFGESQYFYCVVGAFVVEMRPFVYLAVRECNMTLLYLVAAWAAGIFIAASTRSVAGLWLGIALASIALAYAIRRDRPLRLAFLCAALFMFGAARYTVAARPLPSDHIARYVDTGYVSITGLVTRDADVRDNHVNLTIRAESIRLDDEQQPIKGDLLAQAPRYGDYRYGDRVIVSGTLLTPPEFDDFSYRDYLARRGIHAMIPNAQIETLARDQGKPWYAAMYSLKARAQGVIDRLLPSPQAPLLSGILLGVETGIPEDVREAFNRTGTTHVIAISGANIIVVIRVLMGLLQPLFGKRRAGWVALAGVGVYVVFVGADPAVVRAAIMGGLALLAVQWGRRTYGLTSLAFAVWLMTLWNPMTLWDVGFQLSVAATAGLVLFSDDLTHGLESLLQRVFHPSTARSVTQWLAEPVVVSLAAQITTTPLILAYFGRFSIISLLVNILIVPAQSYIMTLGGLAVLAGLVWVPLGEPLAWVVWLPLTYTLDIVRKLGTLDWASMQVRITSAQAWAVYALLLVIAFLRLQHPDDRAALFRRVRQHVTAYAVVVTGLILGVLVWAMALSQPDGKLHVWFLDIGHGHAVLLQTPRGAQILIDGGPNPTQLRRAVGDELPFWDHTLDVLIVTQPKTSAVAALPALLNRYDVQLVLTNGQTGDNDAYRALESAWTDRGLRVLPVVAGHRIETADGVTLKVLHPQEAPDTDTSPEDAGMVIQVSYEDTSFLLTPDLSPQAEQTLLDAGWYAGSTVFELASRGSDKANPDEFIQAVQPQASVVSVGAGNRSGLPASDVVDRVEIASGGPFYRTDQNGTIEMVTDGYTLWIYTDR